MILQGNSIRIPLKDESVHCAISSYPYFGLRSYGLPPTIWGGDSRCVHVWGDSRALIVGNSPSGKTTLTGGKGIRASQLEANTGQFCQLCGAWLGCFGLEPTIALHVQNAVLVSREVKRVLRKDGVFWLNYGDSYATGKNGRSAADTKAVGKDNRTFRDKPFSVTELPAKNLCGIPWRVALALQDDGWVLRSEIPWLKANAMPSSVTDRPGTAHEHVFMLVKSARYYFDLEAVRRPHQQMSKAKGVKGAFHDHTNDMTNGNRIKNKGAETYNPAGRALRTSDPFFDSLDAYITHLQDVRDNGGMLVDSEGVPAALVVNTAQYSAAHYATFPTKLVAPLIQTTPEKVCGNCGKPWQRLKEPTPEYAKYLGKDWADDEKDEAEGRGHFLKPDGTRSGQQRTKRNAPSLTASYVTTGWQPTCKCNNPETVPAVILDCFCGSGTVGAVARELGRRFIGIDLSATYLAENALPRSEKKMSLKALGQLPMFAEAAL